MNIKRANLIAVLFALMANAALADFKPAGDAAERIDVDSVSALLTAEAPLHELDLWPSGTVGEQAIEMSLAQERWGGTDQFVIREIRQRPSSLSLYLSVLVGVGGWHFVRSARHFNMANVPDWYHTGGPVQIGHITPLDISFGTPLVCLFEQPVEHHPLAYRIRLDEGPRLDHQVCLPLAAPRGPPQSV